MLVAEDREEEIELFKMALARSKAQFVPHFVRTGEELMAYLKGEGAYKDRTSFPMPHMLLLDINMPGMDGFEVMDWLRRRADGLRRLPVVVFTMSDDSLHVNRMYDLGANSYLVKPI